MSFLNLMKTLMCLLTMTPDASEEAASVRAARGRGRGRAARGATSTGIGRVAAKSPAKIRGRAPVFTNDGIYADKEFSIEMLETNQELEQD